MALTKTNFHAFDLICRQAWEPNLLADVVWSFGELQYYDHGLFAALAEYLREQAPRFDAAGLAKVRK